MRDGRRITHEFLEAVRLRESRADRLAVPGVMLLVILYAGYQAITGDMLELALAAAGFALITLLAANARLQARVLGRAMNARHALYVTLGGIGLVAAVHVIRLLADVPATGKGSGTFYTLALLLAALAVLALRSLAMLTPRGYRLFASRIPLWEQVLLAANELIAAGLLASTLGGGTLPRLLQPDVFTVRLDAGYALGLNASLVIYYAITQLMWVQRFNDALSETRVWTRLARVLAPLALIVTSAVIARRFLSRADPRTADLLGSAAANLAVLSLGAVLWLVLLVLTALVTLGDRGLRQRFLPDLLLDRLPPRAARFLRTISDTDLLLILGLLATLIPAARFLLGDPGGILSALSALLLSQAGGFVERPEQALALLFALPFYALAVAALALYGYILSRGEVSAEDREELVRALPVSFVIVLILTLYLFAVPVNQVLTQGRLPQLPLDLGRVLALNVLIPLLLLYAHYFVFVRWPYMRGQRRWRERQNARLVREQADTDRRLATLNRELETLEGNWRADRSTGDAGSRLESLFRYVQLNSLRDDLNMQRLQIVAARQQLAEISEAPVSLAVARLPLRVVSLGIPLLIAIQLYQWAFVNNGLREIINTPNLTVDEFFRIILQQANF